MNAKTWFAGIAILVLLVACAPKMEKAPSMPSAPAPAEKVPAAPPSAPPPAVQAPPSAGQATGVQDADIDVGSPESEQDPLSQEDVPTG